MFLLKYTTGARPQDITPSDAVSRPASPECSASPAGTSGFSERIPDRDGSRSSGIGRPEPLDSLPCSLTLSTHRDRDTHDEDFDEPAPGQVPRTVVYPSPSSPPPESSPPPPEYNEAAVSIGRKRRLSDGELDELAEFAKMPKVVRDLSLKADLYALRRSVDHIAVEVEKLWQLPPIFVSQLEKEAYAYLMSPTISSYVSGTLAFFFVHVNRSASRLCLPPDICDIEYRRELALSKAGCCLNERRCFMLNMLRRGVEDKWNLCQLSRAMVSLQYDYKIQRRHWERFAFLRACYIFWEPLAGKDDKEGNKIPSEFWPYADESLARHRGDFGDSLDSRRVLTEILMDDLADFPLQDSQRAPTEEGRSNLTGWQTHAEDASMM